MGFSYSSVVSKIWGGTPVIPDGPAKNAPLWRKVYDTLLGLRDAVLGTLLWSGDFAVSGSAANNFTVTLGAISCALVYDSTNYVPLAYAGGTIDQTAIEGGGGTLGAAVDWWHVYVYSSGGSAAFEISQTAPSDNLVFKSGDNTRRYLGRFRTNASGVPLAVRARRGRYVYREHQQILSGGTDGTATNVYVRPVGTTEESLVPAGVLLAQIEFSVTGPSTAGQTGTGVLYGGGDSSEEAFTMTVQELDGTAVTDRAVIDLELNASYQITYQVTASGGSASASAWCRGWYE